MGDAALNIPFRPRTTPLDATRRARSLSWAAGLPAEGRLARAAASRPAHSRGPRAPAEARSSVAGEAAGRRAAAAHPKEVVLVFLDAMGEYRWPTAGHPW